MYYDYLAVINWAAATRENLIAFLECCYQLEMEE